MNGFDSMNYNPQQRYNMSALGPTSVAPSMGGYGGNPDILDDLFSSRNTVNPEPAQGVPPSQPQHLEQPPYGNAPTSQWLPPTGQPQPPPTHQQPLPPNQFFQPPNEERFHMMGGDRPTDAGIGHPQAPTASANTNAQTPSPALPTTWGMPLPTPPTTAPYAEMSAMQQQQQISTAPQPPQQQPPSSNFYYGPNLTVEAYPAGEKPLNMAGAPSPYTSGPAYTGAPGYFPDSVNQQNRFVDPQHATYAPPPPTSLLATNAGLSPPSYAPPPATSGPSAAFHPAAALYGRSSAAAAAAMVSPPPPPPSIPVVGSGNGYSHDTLAAALSANAQAAAAATRQKTQEEEDREQLEKIIRLRRELEQEEEQEREKALEKETWACPTCTFRNPLPVTNCDMCGTANPRATTSTPPQAPPQQRAPSNSGSSAGEVDIWDCTRCLTRNGGGSQCVVCGTARVSSTNNHRSNSSAAAPHSPARQCPWRCSVCSHVNGPTRSNCEICNGYQRNGIPVEGDYPAAQHVSQQPSPAATAPAAPAAPTVWNCSVCTLENSLRNAVCSACDSGQRPRHLAPPRESKHRSRHGSEKDTPRKSNTESKKPDSSSSASSSTWNCPVCTFINSTKKSKCDMCGTKWAENPHKQDEKQKKREEQSDEEEEIMWQEDHLAKACNQCLGEFGLIRRRHHCRACGYVFCAACSPFHAPLKKDGAPVRLCKSCYTARQGGKK